MTQPRTHPLEWAALACCIVALSYTEWSLAVAAGAHPIVAGAVPGALDIYAIRAMRTRRHVPAVVCSMVGVNALSYLVHAGVVPMRWPVLIVVSAIVPLVFWAVHELGHGEHVPDLAERRKRVLWDVPQDAVLPTVEAAPCGCTTQQSCPKHAAELAPLVAEALGEHTERCTLDEHVDTLPECVPVPELDPVVMHVPEDSIANITMCPCDFGSPCATHPKGHSTPDDGTTVLPVLTDPEDAPVYDTPADVLPLPDGFTRETRTRRTLEEHVAEARVLFPNHLPGVRELKRHTGGGTPRVQQVIRALEEERS